MTALIRAELLKMRTRSAIGLLIAALLLVALTVAVNVPSDDSAHPPVGLHDPRLLAGLVGIGFAVPEVLVVLLGALAATQEFRYGSVTATYLGEPRRNRVLGAKMLSAALVSVVVSCASLAVSVLVGVLAINVRGGQATVSGQLWETIGSAFMVMAAYAAVGVAIGALVRNQIVAVVGLLIWMLVVEQIVVPTYPAVGRWLPAGATDASLQLGPALGLGGRLLNTSLGGFVLAVYAAMAVVLAVRLTPRRDVV